MKENQITVLFETFSAPLLSLLNTKEQQDKAINISKILWLYLITKKDTEDKIYFVLNKIIPKYELVMSLGSLYFDKMKIALTKKEIKKLQKHYSNKDNLDALNNWVDSSWLDLK